MDPSETPNMVFINKTNLAARRLGTVLVKATINNITNLLG
jgi:hypothetical protein